MNLRLNVAIASLIVFFACSAMARLRLEDGEYCFFNMSTNAIVITHLFSDEKELVAGSADPYQRSSVSDLDMFPYTFPKFFRIEYKDQDGKSHTDQLDTSWIALKKAKRGTIYFIYTPEKNLF